MTSPSSWLRKSITAMVLGGVIMLLVEVWIGLLKEAHDELPF